MRTWVIVAVSLLAGCTSYESDLMTETSPGQYQKTRFHGVPIVVTVPQKLGFLVTETTYEVSTSVKLPNGSIGEPTISYITETAIDRNPIPLGDSKLVGLDIKRPIFGTAVTSMALEDQYPTTLASNVDDQTLGKILDAAGNLIEKQGAAEATGGTVVAKRSIKQIQYFLIYDPATGLLSRERFAGL